MATQPKVSILIPVYNTAKYLPKCMASVQNQTLKEIEIVAVNDASPDNAAELLAEYAAKDPRVKVVTHEKNGGILAARLSGIAAASGEYLIFLDADDFLDTDTARACYAKAKKTGADMIHFCFDVRVEHRKKPPFAKQVEQRLRPYDGTLLGRKVFEGAFVDYLYRWNIAGKCISAEVCRKAAAALPPGYYIMAEDFCFYSLMAWFASHYEPLHKKCYHYGLEIGVSAYAMVDFKGFIRNCSVFTALNAVKSFLTSQSAFEQYREAFEGQERKILDDLLDRWEHKLIPQDRLRAFTWMFEHYDPAGLLRSFASYFAGREDDLAVLMGGMPEILSRRTGECPKHVGLYLESAASGRTMAEYLLRCAADWTKNGIRVTVLSRDDEPAALPDGMKRITVPAPLKNAGPEEMIARIGFWTALREKYGIDTVIHGAADASGLLLDALCIRLSKMNLILLPQTGSHSLTGSTAGGFIAKMRAMLTADSVGAATEADRRFYASFGIPCCLLRGNAAGDPPEKIPSGRKKLLWLGCPGDAEAETAIFAWSKAAPAFPEWKLCMYCLTPPAAALRGLATLIDTLGLRDRIEIRECPDGFEQDLSESALLFTLSEEMPGWYADRAGAEGVPMLTAPGVTPEELSEKLTSLLNGAPVPQRERPSGDDGMELFRLSASGPIPGTEPLRELLEMLNRYQLGHEPYMVLPEARGASFVPIYRKADALGYRLLPPESPRRDFVFRALRYVLRHLQRK
ncbi:MAG: glycosyltransferase [Lentisphaeria bacterium]|nr:glycosyltransferase [Lentisphaeria bacterium]